MAPYRILHITDFHISDTSNSSKEFLRRDFYQRYIKTLCELISSKIGPIDFIIATGDFIDQGKTRMFPHAKKVLEYFGEILKVNSGRIGVCIGNHDIIVKEDPGKTQIIYENRKPFHNFESTFSLKFGKIHSEERFSLSKMAENVFFLSIDSTLGRTTNKPGKISDQEINRMISTLKDAGLNHPSNLLIIATHYPLTVFENFLFPDVDGWFDHHFWRSGGLIYERIKNDFKEVQILWLFGDTHLPSEEIRNRQLIVMSGRIGEKPRITDEEKEYKEFIVNSRHARVIEYKDDNKTNIYTCSFNVKTYNENPQHVDWRIHNPDEYKYEVDSPVLIKCHGNETFEEEIKEYVINKNLYRFNRFIIGDRPDEICLGWVSINNLLGDNNGFLQSIISNSKIWLSEILQPDELKKTILIGIDFWGSIIACQLSVLLQIKTYCKASRGLQEHFTDNELFHDGDNVHDFSGYDNVVLISDVVSSGKTLKKVYDIIEQLFDKKKVKIKKTIAISIISDIREHKRIRLNFLTYFGTFCSNIRIPIVTKDFLPDEALLPAKKYFN